MSNKETGGPAFPVRQLHTTLPGMGLRDYFAAKALSGLLSDLPQACYGLYWAAKTASTAYEVADAMLKARAS